MMNEEQDFPTMPAAPLRPELAQRFLSAMQAASAEEVGDELECRLRRLRPAPIGTGRQKAWAEKMQVVAKVPRYDARRGLLTLHRWGVAAVLFLLCSTGVVFVMSGSASATVHSGFACRSVMESHLEESVQWQEGQTALRACEVLYEDSFVMEGEEGCTITVRVPVRTQVMIEEEVI